MGCLPLVEHVSLLLAGSAFGAFSGCRQAAGLADKGISRPYLVFTKNERGAIGINGVSNNPEWVLVCSRML